MYLTNIHEALQMAMRHYARCLQPAKLCTERAFPSLLRGELGAFQAYVSCSQCTAGFHFHTSSHMYSCRVWSYMVGFQCTGTESISGAKLQHRSEILDPGLRNYIASLWSIIFLIQKKKTLTDKTSR